MSSQVQHGLTVQPITIFKKGVFNLDPKQAERKANNQKQYQNQLKRQMQENKRRKQLQKKKIQQQDIKLQQKIIQQSKIQQQRRKNDKTYKTFQNQNQYHLANNKNTNFNNNNNNNKNINNNNIHSNDNNIQINLNQKQSSTQNHYHTDRPNVQLLDHPFEDLSIKQFSTDHYHYQKPIYQTQQQRYLKEQRQENLRRYQQTLDIKLNQIINQIQESKRSLKLQGQLQKIRVGLSRGINNYRQNYQNKMALSNYFQDQTSQFQFIPKKISHKNYQKKNLIGNSTYRFKTNANYILNPINHNHGQSRITNFQQSNFRKGNKKDKDNWGNNKIEGNFLGNRQALDFKIDNIMERIDNLLHK